MLCVKSIYRIIHFIVEPYYIKHLFYKVILASEILLLERKNMRQALLASLGY